MSNLDWFVLIFTLLFIVIYGIWKTRGAQNLQSYLKGDNDAKWWGIGFLSWLLKQVPSHFYLRLDKPIQTA